jgi:ATP:cob(I)alamin adenosyltransferase
MRLTPQPEWTQNDLFDFGSDICVPPRPEDDERHHSRLRVSPDQVDRLVERIDQVNVTLPPLTPFVVPGGTPLSTLLPVARPICRRAERDAVALAATEPMAPEVITYLNRLSELLFVLARAANGVGGETTWKPGGVERNVVGVMTDFFVTVAMPLIIRVADWVFVRRRKRLARSAEHNTPLVVRVTRVDREDWTVAMSSEVSSDEARDLEGREVPEALNCLRSKGAVDYRESLVKLSLRGCVETGCTVTNMRLDRECSPPLSGARVHAPSAGATSAILLRIGLDSPTPVVWEWSEDGARERVGVLPYFLTHSIRVGLDEVVDVLVWGDAALQLVKWTLVLDVDVHGDLVEVRVDDAGRPFMTSGNPEGGFSQDLLWAWFDGGKLVHAMPMGLPGAPIANPSSS